jgi:hypothetical protein
VRDLPAAANGNSDATVPDVAVPPALEMAIATSLDVCDSIVPAGAEDCAPMPVIADRRQAQTASQLSPPVQAERRATDTDDDA